MKTNRILKIAGITSFIAVAAIWLGTQLIDNGAYKTSMLSRISVLAVLAIALWTLPRKGTIAWEKPLLFCSFLLAALGDGLLSLQMTVPGIGAFLSAQVLNTIIFTRRIGAHAGHVTTVRSRIYRCVSGLIVAGAILGYIVPRVSGGIMIAAVCAYVAMITVMAVQAVSAYVAAPAGNLKQLWGRSAIGGVSQLASDVMLGYTMFVGPFIAHDFIVMGTYWLAIWLYAASLKPAE